jgi:cell division protein FtsB
MENIRHGYASNPFEIEANERENDPLTDEERKLKQEIKCHAFTK